MARYILNRILYMIPTVIIIIILGFMIMELPPGDYVSVYIQQLESQGMQGARDQADALRARYALDKPLYERFATWIWHFVQGDFGQSFAYNKPVRDLIGENLFLTVLLSLISLFIAWMIAIPAGVYSATHQYSPGDYAFTLVAFLGVGIPGFLLALVLLVIGVKAFGYVPSGLFSPAFEKAPWTVDRVVDLLRHIWVPALIVAVTDTAVLIRMMRGNLLDVLRLNYVQAARARGATENTVVWKHAVRNAMHPLVMTLGMSLPVLISGTAITGIVLNLPVMGPMYLQAIRQNDIYLAGTFLILITLLLVVGNLLADILLAFVDPRIRYD